MSGANGPLAVADIDATLAHRADQALLGALLDYGAMVLRGRRQASGTGPQESGGPDRQLAGADAWLSPATGRRRGASHPGAAADGHGRLAPGTQRLARALAPIAKRLRDPVAAERLGSEAVAGVVSPNGKTGKVTAADLQDLVLAGSPGCCTSRGRPGGPAEPVPCCVKRLCSAHGSPGPAGDRAMG
jgi:hypothetical protein